MLKWHVSPVPRIAAAGLILGAGLCGTSLANDVWQSGRFAFSDELGGFSIQNVTGTGTKRDPYVIRQTLDTADAATLVIRTRDMKNVAKLPNNNVTHSSIHVQIVTLNNSNLTWIGLGFELQESIDVASTYGDGLSFDQLGRRSSDIYSNRFSEFEDQLEPAVTDRAVDAG